MSMEEYLLFEESSPVRHEFVAGEVYAMSGASKRHNTIAGNIYAHLRAAARGGPCRVFFAEVKLRVAADRIYYPDVTVHCPQAPGDAHIVSDPYLVVEVNSPSTARIDRGEKLDAYRRIASLRAYLVVEQARQRVVRHWRDDSGVWQREEITGDGSVSVPCPETALTLEQIYESVDSTTIAEPEMAEYEA